MLTMHEDWFRLARLPEEPRRRRGDAGHRPRGGTRDHARRRRTPTCSSSTPARSSIARSRSRSTPSSRWRSRSATASCSRLVVTGCLAERYRDELKKEIPEIDAVLGTGEVPEIRGRDRRSRTGIADRDRTSAAGVPSPMSPSPVLAPSTIATSRTSRIATRDPRALPTYIYDADTPRLLTTPRHFAYVKIAEGCDYTCAFCIIPTLRGEYRSRDARLDRARGAGAGGARRARAAAHLAGHDLLRHRPRRARRARASAARAERDRRARSGSGCSTSTRRRSPTTCSTRWRSARRCAATSTCRCSTRRPTC